MDTYMNLQAISDRIENLTLFWPDQILTWLMLYPY